LATVGGGEIQTIDNVRSRKTVEHALPASA